MKADWQTLPPLSTGIIVPFLIQGLPSLAERSYAMADTTAVLDRNVFDVGAFSAVDVVPTVWKVSVPREHRKNAQGTVVPVVIHIEDVTTTPGRRYPFNPAVLPQIELRTADGTVVQAFANMTNVGTGVYEYTYQLSGSAVKSSYYARFTAVNGSITAVTPPVRVFDVV